MNAPMPAPRSSQPMTPLNRPMASFTAYLHACHCFCQNVPSSFSQVMSSQPQPPETFTFFT